MLLRLNVSAVAGGTLLATLSQQEGFFPYRLDNFSSETLHVRCQALAGAARLACPQQQSPELSRPGRCQSECVSPGVFSPAHLHQRLSLQSACSQQGCQEQEDILRPYACLDYAWDEPSLPHQLVLALPGNLQLGSYALDKVLPLWSTRSLPALSCTQSLHFYSSRA